MQSSGFDYSTVYYRLKCDKRLHTIITLTSAVYTRGLVVRYVLATQNRLNVFTAKLYAYRAADKIKDDESRNGRRRKK